MRSDATVDCAVMAKQVHKISVGHIPLLLGAAVNDDRSCTRGCEQLHHAVNVDLAFIVAKAHLPAGQQAQGQGGNACWQRAAWKSRVQGCRALAAALCTQLPAPATKRVKVCLSHAQCGMSSIQVLLSCNLPCFCPCSPSPSIAA
eukprot:366337-Chlamydomonas_euryale.AAC.15